MENFPFLHLIEIYYFDTSISSTVEVNSFLQHRDSFCQYLCRKWIYSEECRLMGRYAVWEPHAVQSKKTAFFIVTAVKTSNLT
jgi:hypothetical protein